MPFLRQTLGELRRYHRLLMVGGRWATAFVMTLALVAVMVYLVRTHIENERQTFAHAHRLIQSRVAANEHSFLTGLVQAELSLDYDPAVPRRLIEQFRANGNLLRWKPSASEQLDVLLAGAPHATPSDAALERAFAFAMQMERANIAASKVLRRPLTQIFFNLDRSLVAILPASSVVHPERLATDDGRRRFVRELTDGMAGLPVGASGNFRNVVPKAYWIPRLYTLPTDRNVLQLASPVTSSGKIEIVLISEIDPNDLIEPIEADAYDGVFAIVDGTGNIVATASRREPDRAALDFVSRWSPTHRLDAGHMTISRSGGRTVLAQGLVGDKSLSLVYTYSWQDTVAAILANSVMAAAIALTVIAAIWWLLHLLNRRVFLPLYVRSEQVFESERLSRKMIETVPVGIGLVSTTTDELLYGGSSLLALTDALVGGMPRLLTELSKRYSRLRSTHGGPNDEVFQEDIALAARDGSEIALQARFALSHYLGEEVLVAAFVDMTANKQLQLQLHKAKLAADQANAAKSAFLATMSHEIRTPLNAILGNLELLAHSPLNPLQRDRLRTIRTSSNGLLTIIQDVLDFSKIEAGAMHFENIPFNAADVITRALAMFAPAAHAKGVALYGQFGRSIDQQMHGDPARLAQVVHNLLSNAIKFTAEGAVTLGISYKASLDGPLAGSALNITVADTGVGIGPTQREPLFKAFAQADSSISRRFGGTGLGLALCQRLTAGMGGTIVLESEERKGSCFTVRVPLNQVDPASACVTPDSRIFAGQHVTFLAASDAWHAYAVPLMAAWGVDVEAAHHPDEIADANHRLLVICGDRTEWPADSENQLVEDCAALVKCSVDGPLQPVRVGRMLTVSCYSPAGLRAALEHLLNGRTLVPLDDARTTEGDTIADTAPAPRLGLHVLVAEDNEVNQRLFDEQLKLLGCTSKIVANGVEALQVLSDDTFDVVLTDLHMPHMDGYLLANIMREHWPHVPIVAVTADATVDERRRCAELGICTVESKPLSLGRLANILALVSNAVNVPRSDVANGGPPLGNDEIPPAIVDAFHRTRSKSLDMLRVALSRGDTHLMLAELHSLKGALSIFRLYELEQRCGKLERQIREDGLSGVDAPVQELIDAIAALPRSDER